MDIVGWWKEYFKELLNTIDTPSTEEAGVGDSANTQGKVTKVDRKLLGGKVEIHPEYLEDGGLSWLTCLCSIVWRSGTLLLEWPTMVVVALFKKGGPKCVFQL